MFQKHVFSEKSNVTYEHDLLNGSLAILLAEASMLMHGYSLRKVATCMQPSDGITSVKLRYYTFAMFDILSDCSAFLLLCVMVTIWCLG